MRISFRTALAIALGWTAFSDVAAAQSYLLPTGQPNSAVDAPQTLPHSGSGPWPTYTRPEAYGSGLAPTTPPAQLGYPVVARNPYGAPELSGPSMPVGYGFRQDQVPAPPTNDIVLPPIPGSEGYAAPIQQSPSDLPAPQPMPEAEGTYFDAPGRWNGTVWDDASGELGSDSACGSAACGVPCCRPAWFGGMYGLLMERDYESNVPLSYEAGMPGMQVLGSRDSDLGSMGGYEVFFGRQMCNGWAWQVSYWGLFSETGVGRAADMPDSYLYGLSMVDYAPSGWPQDDVLSFYNAAEAHEVVRTNEFHNIELNFIRYNIGFPSAFGGACGGAGGYGVANNCSPGWSGSMFAGPRFFRFDEYFSYRSTFDGTYVANPRDVFYDIDVENNLIGFQLGGNVNYNLTCRWSLFTGTKLGIYNNHISHQSAIYGPSGVAMPNSGGFAGTPYDIQSSKDDIAFLGEFNVGVGYQFSQHWRATVGYRVMGATGIALAPAQIPANFAYLPGVAQVDSDGSLILHGAFAGLEFCW